MSYAARMASAELHTIAAELDTPAPGKSEASEVWCQDMKGPALVRKQGTKPAFTPITFGQALMSMNCGQGS